MEAKRESVLVVLVLVAKDVLKPLWIFQPLSPSLSIDPTSTFPPSLPSSLHVHDKHDGGGE